MATTNKLTLGCRKTPLVSYQLICTFVSPFEKSRIPDFCIFSSSYSSSSSPCIGKMWISCILVIESPWGRVQRDRGTQRRFFLAALLHKGIQSGSLSGLSSHRLLSCSRRLRMPEKNRCLSVYNDLLCVELQSILDIPFSNTSKQPSISVGFFGKYLAHNIV